MVCIYTGAPKHFKEGIYQMSNLKHNTSRRKKAFLSNLLGIILIFFFLIILAVLILYLKFHSYLEIAYDSYRTGIDTSRIDYHSVPYLYDKDGNEIYCYYGYHTSEEDDRVPTYSSVYTFLEDIPEYTYNAFVAIEDETFFENYGFSPKRSLAAVISYELKGNSSFGASTVTQQLVKIATDDRDHSPERKSREIGAAIYLTEHWSKKQILESYINIAYYGHGNYGIYKASMDYFGKNPKNLTIAESATLAAMLNKPEKNCPYNGPEAINRLNERKNLVLEKMLELAFISEEEYNLAIKEPILYIGEQFEYVDKAKMQYIQIAMKQAKEIVMEYYGLENTDMAMQEILNGNTKIYTNLDLALQQKSYEALKNTYPNDSIEMGYVLTTKDGKVLVAISSKNDSNIDHVYSMTRQTGSSIKPLSVYGPAFDMEICTPDSIEIDEPVTIDNWSVSNASRNYRGAVTIQDALAYSINTIAVKTSQKVGISTSISYLEKLGVTSLCDDDYYYPAVALGGLTYGISPFEMCQAYNTINNNGLFSRCSFISKIEINGITIVPNRETQSVFSYNTSVYLKNCLSAAATYGTARKANLEFITTYAKTGTTTNKADFWTCGFTDDITAVIWAGYDTPQTIQVIPSGELNQIWHDTVSLYYE